MPSIEVGTVGGGTFLPAQSTCLDILNVKGASYDRPGAHADQVRFLFEPEKRDGQKTQFVSQNCQFCRQLLSVWNVAHLLHFV